MTSVCPTPPPREADLPTDFILSPNVIYEFSINPDDKHQYPDSKDGRFQKVKSDIQDILQDSSKNFKYALYPEMSMPQYGRQDKNRYSRCHYHGIIMFTEPSALFGFLTKRWHLLTAHNTVQLNHYRPERWRTYATKQKWLVPKRYQIINCTWSSIESISKKSSPPQSEQSI